MVGFALSCFGLLLFLWLAFGGPVPLKPKGYRINASFAAGLAARDRGGRADLRRAGRQGQGDRAGRGDRPRRRDDGAAVAKYAPLPSDARAILRQKTLLGETYVELTPGSAGAPKLPEGGSLPEGAVSDTVELDEILRTFDPRDARGVPAVDADPGRGDRRPRARHQRRARQPRAVRGGRRRARRHPQPPAAGGAVADLQHRRRVRRADRARRPAARPDRERQPRVRTTASRDRELQETFVALPTFERESRETIDRLTEFARDTDPLVTQLRPAARELSPTLTDLSDARAGPQGVLPRARPADRRVGAPASRGRARARGPAAAARPARPGAAPAQPGARLPRALQAAS